MPRTGTSALRAARDNPGLTDVIKAAMRNAKLGIRTALPGKVVSYTAATQTATIQAELIPVMNTETGVQPQLPLKLVEIPVAWCRTSAGYLTLPLVAGDTGLLIVCDRSIDKWTTKGVTTDPGFNHTHNLIDGVFYPGLHPDTNPIVPATSDTATVLEGPQVHLGSGAADFVALKTKVETELTRLHTAISNAAVAAGDGGATFKANILLALLPVFPNPVGASKVKAV